MWFDNNNCLQNYNVNLKRPIKKPWINIDSQWVRPGERYRTEFVTELRSVEQQVEVLRQAHADDNTRIGQGRKNSILISSNTSLAEVQAELEASTPRFNKIATPDFGVDAMKNAMQSQSAPIQTETSSFPIPPGTCKDCGHADVRMPPPGLGTPMPSTGLLYQTPSAAAASLLPGLNFSKLSGTGGEDGSSYPQPGRNQGQQYESFGEHPNNSQNPSRPARVQRNGGDFPNDHDDDDGDDNDDGSGVYAQRRSLVIGWCDICKKNVRSNQIYRWCVICSTNLLHHKCLQNIGRSKAECLRCEDIKIKKQHLSDGGGGPPPNDPDGYYDGEGGPNWARGRRDRENRERKPTREDVISKLATRILPKLEVKNAHDLSAIELKLLWDTWLTRIP
eukprot:211249-Amphidinium_carterae.2